MIRACVADVEAALGRELSIEEAEYVSEELRRRVKRHMADDTLNSYQRALSLSAEDFKAHVRRLALLDKRNTALNWKAKVSLLNLVTKEFADNPELGVEAFLVSVNSPRLGARNSVSSAQRARSGKYIAGLLTEIEQTPHWDYFKSGGNDLAISEALWAYGKPEFSKMPKPAREVAEIIYRWQEVARLEANENGADIGKLEGYIARQSHSQRKISRVDQEVWVKKIKDRLDLDRMKEAVDERIAAAGPALEQVERELKATRRARVKDRAREDALIRERDLLKRFLKDGRRREASMKDIDDYLAGVYDGFVSGVHHRLDEAPTGLRGLGNVGRQMGAERSLHFKSAKDWFEYNKEFGTDSLREAVINGLDRSGRATGLMEVMGPNARLNYEDVVDQVKRRIKDPIQLQKFEASFKEKLENRWKELDGTSQTAVDEFAANVGANVRGVQSMSKLGGAVMSAFPDIALFGAEMSYNGQGFLSGMGRAMGSLRKGTPEERAVVADIGVFSDGMRGAITSRFSGHDDLNGKMARAMELFFKVNLLGPWTDALTRGAALMLSNGLATAPARFADLDPSLVRSLRLYGIEEPEWRVIKHSGTRAADGRDYVQPSLVREVPDEVIKEAFPKGRVSAERRRRDIEQKLRRYFTDRTEFAVIKPDARTQAMLYHGTQPGTWKGEALRFIMQFKAFPITVISKALGREVYGRSAGAAAYGLSIRQRVSAMQNGEFVGLARMILAATALGYLSMVAKDTAKNLEPRDPTSPSTWAAAMVQGGAMGIYGDFLFGEMRNRFGATFIGTLLGPTAGEIDDLADVIGRARAGDDFGAAAFDFARSNTPFANLFWLRGAMDAVIVSEIQEALNPGYRDRYLRRLKQQNDQEPLIN